MKKARLITVVIEKTDAGLLRATSPDFKGLHVSARSVDGLKSAVKDVLVELLQARGESACVYETESSDSNVPPPWVIVPTQQASSYC